MTNYKDKILQITSPISGSEYSLVKAFTFERQLVLSITRSIENEMINAESGFSGYFNRVLAKLFYLPNAGHNLFYDFHEFNISTAKVTAFDLDEATKLKELGEKELLGFGIDFLHLRNPISKILVSIAQPSYGSYIERQHDADGYLTLVRLQQKLIAEKISSNQLSILLQEFPDPYTRQPMRIGYFYKSITQA